VIDRFSCSKEEEDDDVDESNEDMPFRFDSVVAQLTVINNNNKK
jgi:hypothetical protein